ncbi:MAG TPA: hypothetical protein VMI11_13830 [Actinomycetes bacterium]|nr:hypothetical protein [Actinomycetes bacterium]
MVDMNDEELERDLRRVLADRGNRPPDRSVPLERVYAGADRRRRRKQALAATLSVLAVVGLGLGITHPWASGGPQAVPGSSGAQTTAAASSIQASLYHSPASSPASSSVATTGGTSLADLTDTASVSAIDDRHWWVAANRSCTGCGGALVTTSDGGATFAPASNVTLPNRLAGVRFVDSTHGTVMTQDGTLATTADGGQTLRDIGPVKGYFALEAGGSTTTYALQQATDSSIHLWRQAGSGSWRDVATIPGTATSGAANIQLAVQGDRAVVVWRNANAVVSASYDSDGKTTGTHPVTGCDVTLGLSSLSGGRGGVWLSCPTGTADAVLRSTDLGTTWQSVPVQGPAGRHTVGAIDATHAVISTSDTALAVVDANGTLEREVHVNGVSGGWRYLGFTNATHGFAITGKGQLLRSTDGGHSWIAVTFSR